MESITNEPVTEPVIHWVSDVEVDPETVLDGRDEVYLGYSVLPNFGVDIEARVQLPRPYFTRYAGLSLHGNSRLVERDRRAAEEMLSESPSVIQKKFWDAYDDDDEPAESGCPCPDCLGYDIEIPAAVLY